MERRQFLRLTAAATLLPQALLEGCSSPDPEKAVPYLTVADITSLEKKAYSIKDEGYYNYTEKAMGTVEKWWREGTGNKAEAMIFGHNSGVYALYKPAVEEENRAFSKTTITTIYQETSYGPLAVVEVNGSINPTIRTEFDPRLQEAFIKQEVAATYVTLMGLSSVMSGRGVNLLNPLEHQLEREQMTLTTGKELIDATIAYISQNPARLISRLESTMFILPVVDKNVRGEPDLGRDSEGRYFAQMKGRPIKDNGEIGVGLGELSEIAKKYPSLSKMAYELNFMNYPPRIDTIQNWQNFRSRLLTVS